MNIIELCLIASLWCGASPVSPSAGFGGCVPTDIYLNSLVVSEPQTPASRLGVRLLTVKQRLIQLKARCKKGQLIDRKGKPVYLYPLIGCWGNPPADYLDLPKHQEQEIQRLKKKYVVIQISCAQADDPRTISQKAF